MSWLHKILLYIHILSVIMSVGPFFLLLPMVKRWRQNSDSGEQAYVEQFRSAITLAKHSGHVLVVTGILLVSVSSWTWGAPWIVTTVIILVCSLYFLARAFSPTLRKFSEAGNDRKELLRKLNRSVLIYLALLLVMLWFMVAKPILWR